MDKNMEQGNRIIKSAYYFSIFATIMLLVGGLVCIIIGANNKVMSVTSTGNIVEVGKPLMGLIAGGICMWIIGVPLVWFVFKPLMDGYGIIVCSAANQLKKDGVETFLDIQNKADSSITQQNEYQQVQLEKDKVTTDTASGETVDQSKEEEMTSCRLCGKMTDKSRYSKIVDNMGTRYGFLCEKCFKNNNCTIVPEKK